MIRDSKSRSFRFGKIQTVTGIVTVPAIGNIARMGRKIHPRQFRRAQGCAIAIFVASLAVCEVLREIR
jgi:hypothetical protein